MRPHRAEAVRPGLVAGVVLVMLGTFGLSWLMRRTPGFGRATWVFGVLGGIVGLGYYVGIAFPSTRIFLLEAAAPFFLLWVLLSARALLRAAPPETTLLAPSLDLGGTTRTR